MSVAITLRRCAAPLMISALAMPVQAEQGDYNFWQTLSNLVVAPAADNKVTPAQRLGPYPLLANPSGFNSGFKPANYYAWQTVQMAPQTGAVCGNGSPYKFFVNRVPIPATPSSTWRAAGPAGITPVAPVKAAFAGHVTPTAFPMTT